MSKLDELIREYCPDGVEYKTLGQVAHYAKNRIDADAVTENTYVGVENLLQNKAGKTVAVSVPTKGTVIAFNPHDILIGNIRPYLKKIWLSDCAGGTNGDVLVIQIDERKRLLPKYLFYVLSSDRFFLYDMQNSKGAKMPRGNKAAILKYRIPVPPLPVQGEIVRILDNFTELTAELTAREKQYEFYRNKLLTFGDVRGRATSDVVWRTLGEVIVSLNTGLNPRKFFKLNTDDACNYYVTIREIQNGTIVFSDKTDKINDEALKLCNNRSNLEVGDVLFSGTGTIGETAVINKPPMNWNIKEGVYVIKPRKDMINSRFLMYILRTDAMKAAIAKKVAGGTVKSIPMAEMRKLQLPVPSLSVQTRLVNVLDNFDAICSDLKIGLPAEIEARQKQYEFYRDALLTYAATGKTILTDRQTDRQTEHN